MKYSLQPRGKKGLISMVFYYRGKQRWIALGTSDMQVARKRAQLIAEQADQGVLEEHRNVTLGEFLDMWLKVYAKQKALTTYESYKGNVENHINPALGKVKMCELRPIDLQLYYAEKVKELSPTTVNYQHRILCVALDHAVAWEYVSRNVARAAIPPQKADYEAEVWTAQESRKFLEAVKNDALFGVYATVAFTGMRRGEVLGLRWQDCDLENGLVRVRQTAVLTNSEGVIFKGPKSKKGRRLIPIGPVLVRILREQQELVAKMKARAKEKGYAWEDHDLVFPNRFGRPQDPSNLTGRHFPRMCRKAGVKKIRFHDIRHTHLTAFLSESKNLKLVQERAGHSSIKLTGDTYVHPEVELQREGAARVEEVILGGV